MKSTIKLLTKNKKTVNSCRDKFYTINEKLLKSHFLVKKNTHTHRNKNINNNGTLKNTSLTV